MSIAAIATGVLVLTTVSTNAVASTVRNVQSETIERTANAAGVETVIVDASASAIVVTYGNVSEATLTVEGPDADSWTLTRDGDALTATSDRDWWANWNILGTEREDRGTLTLPRELAGVDARMTVSAGTITADGDFGDLRLDMSAGRIDVDGAAAALEVDVSAGEANLDLENVRSADISVSAGSVDGTLAGTAPDTVAIDVSAGNVALELPDVTYDVNSEVMAGDLNNALETASSADNRIDVTVSAGDVELSPGE